MTLSLAVAETDKASYGGVLKGLFGGSSTSKTRETVEAVGEQITKNKELKKERNKLLDLVGQYDQLALVPTTINGIYKQRVDQEIDKNDAIDKTAKNLNRQSAVDGNFNNSQLEKGCETRVNFSGTKFSAEQTTQFNLLKSLVSDVTATRDEKLQKENQALFAKAAAKFEDLINKDDAKYSKNYSDEGAQTLYTDDAAQISAVKKDVAKQEKKNKNVIGSIIKTISEVAKKTADLNKNSREASEIADQAATDMFNKVAKVRQEQSDAAVQLRKNCLKMANVLGRGANAFAPNTLLGSASELMKGWAPTYAASTEFVNMIQGVSAGLTCPDVTADVEGNWTPVLSAIETMRGATDLAVLANTAVAVADSAQAAQTQMLSKVQPIIDGCNFASRNRDAVESFVSNLNSQLQQQGGATGSGSAGAVPRTTRGRSGTPNASALAASHLIRPSSNSVR